MERSPPVGRPCLGGTRRHEQLYRLTDECVDKKVAVLAFLARYGMPATMEEFYMHLSKAAKSLKRTTILRWRREQTKLEAAAAACEGGHVKIRDRGVGTVLSSELETDNVLWVNEFRAVRIPVTTLVLTDKARQVAAEANVETFSASDKWVMGYKRQHHFSLCSPTRQGQVAQLTSMLFAPHSPLQLTPPCASSASLACTMQTKQVCNTRLHRLSFINTRKQHLTSFSVHLHSLTFANVL